MPNSQPNCPADPRHNDGRRQTDRARAIWDRIGPVVLGAVFGISCAFGGYSWCARDFREVITVLNERHQAATDALRASADGEKELLRSYLREKNVKIDQKDDEIRTLTRQLAEMGRSAGSSAQTAGRAAATSAETVRLLTPEAKAKD